MSRTHPMSKSTITRLFVAGMVALAAGAVVVLAAVWAAFSSNVFVTVALVVVGGLAMLAGALAAVASWIGALFNTWQLEDKLWFVSLLVLGLFSGGVLGMVAYVFAGPDGTSRGPAHAGVALGIGHQNVEVR